MDKLTAFKVFIISLPVLVTIFYSFYLSQLGRKQPALRAVAQRSTLLVWGWFLAAAAIAYFRVFSQKVSFENGDVLTFSTYATLIALGPMLAWLAYKQSASFRKLLLAIPAYVLVASQLIRLGGYAYWEAYKVGEIPFHLGASIAGMDVFLALCTPFLAYALYKKHHWAARATLAWAWLGLLDVASGTVQMILLFFGYGAMNGVAIHLPLSNLIELYQVGIGLIIHVHLIHRYKLTKL